MSEENKQVALQFITAMSAGDTDGAAPFLDPEAFTLAKGYGKFGGIRRYDTIIGTISALKQLVPTGLRPIFHTVTAEADRVIVEFEGNGVTREGKPYQNQYCWVFTLSAGRIIKVHEYFCTIHADAVLWPLVEAMQDEIPS